MNRISLLLLAFTCVGASVDRADDSKKREQAVRSYLQVKYDEFDETDDGRRIYGPAYDPTAPLEAVKVEEFERFLPTTTFSRTMLDTPYFEYPKLEVIVAVTKSGEKYDVRSCVSPLFAAPSPKFLYLIRGKGAMSDEQRRNLAVGMGKLLAAVTYKGQTKNAKIGNRLASVELWHGDLHWRDIEVCFDERNRVEFVFVHGSGEKATTKADE